MIPKIHRCWLAWILFALVGISPVFAEQKKLVIAHYMTDMVPQSKGKALSPWIDPELADPSGSTASIGGIFQTLPMASIRLKDADLTEAVNFEIRAAQQLGVDGFQFYYPLQDNVQVLRNAYNQIIGEFIRQSDTEFPGFKISLCFAHPGSNQASNETQRINLWSPVVRELLDSHKQSKSWLRSETGNLLFYLWVGDALADGVGNRANTPAQIKKIGRAYQNLAKAVGHQIDYIYQVRRFDFDHPYIESILATFPGVWGWTASEEYRILGSSRQAMRGDGRVIYTNGVSGLLQLEGLYKRFVKLSNCPY